MKLIVAGSTGYVGIEIIRQALSHPSITSVIALARRPTEVPEGVDSAKLKSVICDDFINYSDAVKKELSGADACIWLIAVTPSQLKTMPWEETRKICYDYTIAGLETIAQLPRNAAGTPLRFLYTSGAKTVRDPSQKPWILGDYSLMRGEVEVRVLDYATEHKDLIEAAVAKPGLIVQPEKMNLFRKATVAIWLTLIGLPQVTLSEIAATLLDQAVNGFEKEDLLNEDLIRIGQKVLSEQQKGL